MLLCSSARFTIANILFHTSWELSAFPHMQRLLTLNIEHLQFLEPFIGINSLLTQLGPQDNLQDKTIGRLPPLAGKGENGDKNSLIIVVCILYSPGPLRQAVQR